MSKKHKHKKNTNQKTPYSEKRDLIVQPKQRKIYYGEGYNPDGAICWHVGKFLNDTKWGVKKSDLKGFLEKIAKFETQKYKELFKKNSSHHHKVEIDDIDSSARKWFKENKLEDTELWSIRANGKIRIWGIIVERNIFSILWYDPNHEIYPSQKKYT